MRIAMVAPLWETIPPATYGGTELVVDLLARQLHDNGHEVMIYGAGPSPVSAEVPFTAIVEEPLRAMSQRHKAFCPTIYEQELITRILGDAHHYDVIHNHLGFQLLPFARLMETPLLTTLHGVFEPANIRDFLNNYTDLPFVSISDFQRRPCPDLNYVKTIYHGLALHRFPVETASKEESYFAFLGRFSPEKGPHHAIAVAKATGRRLVMAGKVDSVDREYFATEIEPHIDNDLIHYIGEVNHTQKTLLLKDAYATICAVTWPEPFGLVLAESLACGTPVLGVRNGSLKEVITHGSTGFLADEPEELLTYANRMGELSRARCRMEVEQRFSMQRMTEDYETVYEQLVASNIQPLIVDPIPFEPEPVLKTA